MRTVVNVFCVKPLSRHFIFLCVCVMHVFGIYGCATSVYEPKDVTFLTKIPMDNTSVPSYLGIEDVHKSDTQIALIVYWGDVRESEGHTIKWDIFNDSGKHIYTAVDQDIIIRSNMFYCRKVALEEIVPEDLIPGKMRIVLYIDNQKVHSKAINYIDKSLVKDDTRRVVILPFVEECNAPNDWPEHVKNHFQNTVAHALYAEISRIYPDTIPHYIVEQKVGRILSPSCFDTIECTSYIKETFGDSIFITGYTYIQQIVLDASYIIVYVYDSKTGHKEKFHYFTRYLHTYQLLMRDLLEGAVHQKGLLDYLTNM